ncbi:unnamed protein product, partial [Vitis vinifera]
MSYSIIIIPMKLVILSVHVGVRINSGLSTSIRLYSATKFILYIVGGSIFLLPGVLGIGLYGSNEPTLNFDTYNSEEYFFYQALINKPTKSFKLDLIKPKHCRHSLISTLEHFLFPIYRKNPIIVIGLVHSSSNDMDRSNLAIMEFIIRLLNHMKFYPTPYI